MAGKQNDNLIQELRREMEEELDKGPIKMDTVKIKQINLLLATLEGRNTLPPDMEPQQFLQRFHNKYGIDLLADPATNKKSVTFSKRKASWRTKVAIAAIFIAILAGMGNAASVAAMDKSLWQIIKETTHSISYRTSGVEEDTVDETVPEYYETFPDWESLKGSVELPILMPEYIPDGLVLDSIDKSTFDSGVEITAYYKGIEECLNISCECYTIQGDFLKNKGGKEVLGQQKEIGERSVHISMEDGINIIFTEDGVIYTIDTNLDLEETERIIENLK